MAPVRFLRLKLVGLASLEEFGLMLTSDVDGIGSGSGSFRLRALLGPPFPLNFPIRGEIDGGGGTAGGKSSSDGSVTASGGDMTT